MLILMVNVPHPAIGSRASREHLPPLSLLAIAGPLIDAGHKVGLIDGELDYPSNPALLAHRYALSLPVDTVVLGVKNRAELAECVAAADAGPLPADLATRIDQSVDRTAEE